MATDNVSNNFSSLRSGDGLAIRRPTPTSTPTSCVEFTELFESDFAISGFQKSNEPADLGRAPNE